MTWSSIEVGVAFVFVFVCIYFWHIIWMGILCNIMYRIHKHSKHLSNCRTEIQVFLYLYYITHVGGWKWYFTKQEVLPNINFSSPTHMRIYPNIFWKRVRQGMQRSRADNVVVAVAMETISQLIINGPQSNTYNWEPPNIWSIQNVIKVWKLVHR